MLIIEFKNSRSAKFIEAIHNARAFERCTFDETEINRVEIQLKEIFEKWDNFNLLFWIVVDWKGTVVEYDGMRYHSHTDKTRIFYAVQESYQNWINYVRHKLSNLDKVHAGTTTMIEIEGKYLSEDQINDMIDTYSLRNKN